MADNIQLDDNMQLIVDFLKCDYEVLKGGLEDDTKIMECYKEHLEKGKGLNLSFEVRDGIIKHTKGKSGKLIADSSGPCTNEGMIVRISDTIAYANHDVDDAIKYGIALLPENRKEEPETACALRRCSRIHPTNHGNRLLAARPEERNPVSFRCSSR